MRVSTVFVKPLAVLALFGGLVAVAVADGVSGIESLTVVNSTPTCAMLRVVPTPAAVGQICTISANGLPVAQCVLAPGGTYVGVPSFGPATNYTASVPGLEEGKWYNPGSN